MNHNIILIGYMGSGKSTVAKELHIKTGMKVIDTDALLVKEQGRSINEIFQTDGEESFRKLETELLRRLSENTSSYILSTGGGMPVREENRAILKSLGTVFFLQADTDTIFARVKEDTQRPLLQGTDQRTRIDKMLKERTPMYELAADHMIKTDDKTVEDVVGEILRLARN
ncbi:MAG: shikimate kinase [Lachnospiraceae bacterium]|nr:shikimate kinase [Lachnospiraceae bacterium]